MVKIEIYLIAILAIALIITSYLALSVRKKVKYLLDETLHEVNIPLSTIMANAKLLSYSIKDERGVLQIKRLENAAKNLQNLLSTLESNIRNELITPKKDFFDGADVVNGIVCDMKELFCNREIECEIKQFWCETDQYGFSQTVKNIIHNALKFSNDSIKIKLIDGKFSVIDYGCGLEPSKIAFVFERYYQTNSASNGSGIGLFIVKQYCDNSGIKIYIKPNTPCGTEFILDINQIIKEHQNIEKRLNSF